MSKRWVNRRVDLNILNEHIKGFLERKGFETKKTELPGEYHVTGFSGQRSNLPLRVLIRVSGSENDFSVEFVRYEEKHARLYRVFAPFLTLLGGGVIFSRMLEKEEILDRLEWEFFVFLEETVERLAGFSV